MERSWRDALAKSLREVSSRRQLLGALAAAPALFLGGLLVSLGQDEAEARNKGQGRKRSHRAGKEKRQRQRRRRTRKANAILRGHSVLLTNAASAAKSVTIEGIETQYLGKCTLLGKFDLPPGKDGLFDTSNTTLTIQINRHYRFVFMNAAFKTPWVTAGIWGSSDLCPTSVTNVFEESFSEGDVRTVTLEGKEFTLRRNGDKSDFKYWSLDIPANL